MPLFRLIVFIIFFLTVVVMVGFTAAEYPPFLLLGSLMVVVVFALTFLNTEVGIYILIFSMLLSPEIGIGQLAERATSGRGVTLRFDDFLLVIIGFSWFAKNAVYKELGLFLKTPLNRPIFYYMVACLLSTGIGVLAGRVDPKTGFLFVLKYFEYFIVFFMVANHVQNEQHLRRILWCLFLTCFIVSVIGMAQIPGGGRVSAPFEGEAGEPNTLGGYLVLIGAVAGGILSTTRDRKLRWKLLVLIAAIVPPLMATQSRSSYLAALPAIFILAYMSEKRRFILPLLVIGLIASPLFLPSTVKERIAYTFSQRYHEQQLQVGDIRLDTSLSARLMSWKNGLSDWTRHPIFGFGVTGYTFIDAQFIRVIVETGILGLAAFGYLLYALFGLIRATWRQVSDPLHKGLLKGFAAGYVAMLFHAVGANTFIIVRIMEPFWLLVGIITLLPVIESSRESAPQVSESDPSRLLRWGQAKGRPLRDVL
ncbi:MAG: O-antigen ligase family protein [Desulfobacterales bacterium]|nr:O-antigen ligase family protein [Desulfobacterales bacterium]MCF8078441.1 O-antigen ligase family protein [Desulfobacterales bacterium]